MIRQIGINRETLQHMVTILNYIIKLFKKNIYVYSASNRVHRSIHMLLCNLLYLKNNNEVCGMLVLAWLWKKTKVQPMFLIWHNSIIQAKRTVKYYASQKNNLMQIKIHICQLIINWKLIRKIYSCVTYKEPTLWVILIHYNFALLCIFHILISNRLLQTRFLRQ